MTKKQNNIFFSVGKVAFTTGVAPHTIRFWHQQFPQIPAKIGKGNRKYYNQQAIDLFLKIKYLMYEKGLKISGIQKILLSENFDDQLKITILNEDKESKKEGQDLDLLSWADENEKKMNKLIKDDFLDIKEDMQKIKILLNKIK